MNNKTLVVLLLCLVLVTAAVWYTLVADTTSKTNQPITPPPQAVDVPNTAASTNTTNATQNIAFSFYNPIYRFNAAIAEQWAVEYIPEIESINIYNPLASGETKRAQSQIFIRYFTAQDFLTLTTVDIISRQAVEVHGHAAVQYEIQKKTEVPDFPHQPVWRNSKHKLVDVRLSSANPSTFYVFSYNPELREEVFNQFIESLLFHNDVRSFTAPIQEAAQRITKKPFGIKVSPNNSPVSPEKFSGYHTAIDLEILPGEENKDIEVFTLCGGKIIERKTATGYGGVVVQECLLDDRQITVVYGHLELRSVWPAIGTYLAPGQVLGILGAGESEDSGGERKHLHLGIHKGSRIDIRGYVSSEAALSEWIDPRTVF